MWSARHRVLVALVLAACGLLAGCQGGGPPGGAGPVRLSRGGPEWSASGSYIAVVQKDAAGDRHKSVILSPDAKTGAAEKVVEREVWAFWEPFAHWAPTGQDRIAYLGKESWLRGAARIHRGGWPIGGRLVIASPEGKALGSYGFVGDCVGLCWKDDGTRIALALLEAKGRRLEIITAGENKPPRLLRTMPIPEAFVTAWPGEMEWQPGGSLVLSALLKGGLSLVVVDTVSGKIETLVEKETFGSRIGFRSWVWSRDGKEVHFVASDKDGAVSLYTVSASGKTKPSLRATLAVERVRIVRWSRDRKRIAFIAGAPRGMAGDLCVGNPDGTGIERLTRTADAMWHSFSPDGTKLAFVRAGPTMMPTSLMVVDLRTKQTRQIWPPGRP